MVDFTIWKLDTNCVWKMNTGLSGFQMVTVLVMWLDRTKNNCLVWFETRPFTNQKCFNHMNSLMFRWCSQQYSKSIGCPTWKQKRVPHSLQKKMTVELKFPMKVDQKVPVKKFCAFSHGSEHWEQDTHPAVLWLLQYGSGHVQPCRGEEGRFSEKIQGRF
jgi:hypothetical protein